MEKEELLNLKNKEFIFACLKIVALKHNAENLRTLTSPYECKRKFDMNYPIIQRVNFIGNIDEKMCRDSCGHRRYYPDTIIIDGEKYIVCNDWYYHTKRNTRDTRTNFVDWVLSR